VGPVDGEDVRTAIRCGRNEEVSTVELKAVSVLVVTGRKSNSWLMLWLGRIYVCDRPERFEQVKEEMSGESSGYLIGSWKRS
jgi:hypothetical protein